MICAGAFVASFLGHPAVLLSMDVNHDVILHFEQKDVVMEGGLLLFLFVC